MRGTCSCTDLYCPRSSRTIVCVGSPSILVPPELLPVNKLNVFVPLAIAPLNIFAVSVAPLIAPLNSVKF